MPETVRVGQQDEDRLDRSRRLGWLDVDAIGRAQFLVAGAGALGNDVVKNLVLSGSRRIVLVDMDRVINRTSTAASSSGGEKNMGAEV